MKKLNNYSKVKICRICITNLKLKNIYLPENGDILKHLKFMVEVQVKKSTTKNRFFVLMKLFSERGLQRITRICVSIML